MQLFVRSSVFQVFVASLAFQLVVGSLVFSVHWLIVSITTDSPIPVVALFLIILWPEVTDAVAAKHALLIGLRAKFTFTSATVLRGLML